MPRPKTKVERVTPTETSSSMQNPPGSETVSVVEYTELCARMDKVEEIAADIARSLIQVLGAVEAATKAVEKPEPPIVVVGGGRGLNLPKP